MWTTRRATVDDHPTIQRLFAELGVPEPPPDAASFERHMLPRVLVACGGSDGSVRGGGDGGGRGGRDDGGREVVGYASWRIYDRLAHVVNVVTAPGARGRGVGRALMTSTRRAALDEGCLRWYLNVKRDNAPARRLYERCGLAHERDLWLLVMRWPQIEALSGERPAAAAQACTPGPEDDAAIADRFGLPRARIASLRARPELTAVALREGGAPAAYAIVDPRLPGAVVLCAARPGLVRPLLDACRPHVPPPPAPDQIRIVVDGERPLMQLLVDAGAEIDFELVQMGGPLEG